MEIKEEQLEFETRQVLYLNRIDITLTQILKVLKERKYR